MHSSTNMICRLLALLLVVAMSVTALASCGNPSDSDESATEITTTAENESATTGETSQNNETGKATETEKVTEKATEPSAPKLSIDKTFSILRSDSSLMAVNACKYIKEALSSLYGLTVTFTTDELVGGKNPDPNEHVILVGQTNREASINAQKELRQDDYSYCVLNANTILISGWTSEGCLNAAKEFCKDAWGYTKVGTGAKADLAIGMAKTFNVGNYPVKNLSINGIDLKDLKILYKGTDNECTTAAKQIVSAISAWTGLMIPVEKDTGADQSAAIRIIGSGSDIISTIEKVNGSVVLSAPSGKVSAIVTEFVNLYLKATPTETMAITISDEQHVIYAVSQAEFNDLKLVDSKETDMGDGFTFYDLSYKDRNNNPVLVRIIKMSKGAGELAIGTPNAEAKVSSLQNVLDQANAYATKYNCTVYGAVNGDLYDTSKVVPHGVTIQNGVKLNDRDNLTTSQFAILKDGSYYIGDYSGLSTKIRNNQVQQCIGGHYLIMKDGKIVTNGTGDSFITVRHPRTAIGYDKDGNLYLIEVDGRQASYSNGASLIDMGIICRNMGMTDVMNLDGGGSSNMYVRDAQSGELTHANHPSENPERKVINSVLFIKNAA